MIYDDTYQFPWTPVTGATHDLLSSCLFYCLQILQFIWEGIWRCYASFLLFYWIPIPLLILN